MCSTRFFSSSARWGRTTQVPLLFLAEAFLAGGGTEETCGLHCGHEEGWGLEPRAYPRALGDVGKAVVQEVQ